MSKTYYRFAASLVVALGLFTNPAYSQTASRDGYIGVISESDDRKPGQQFTFANLRAARPFVTFPTGNGSETTKVFQDDDLIVLIFVANLTGSTETFYLNMKRSQFTLIEVGALEASVTGTDFRPKLTYGTLR